MESYDNSFTNQSLIQKKNYILYLRNFNYFIVSSALGVPKRFQFDEIYQL